MGDEILSSSAKTPLPSFACLLNNIFFAAQTCILAFQHYIVMLGTTVLITNSIVPFMGGKAVSSKLFLLMIIEVNVDRL